MVLTDSRRAVLLPRKPWSVVLSQLEFVRPTESECNPI